MATIATISEPEYLRTSYEHDCEWIEGEVRERAMPDKFHSALRAFFVGSFFQAGRTPGLRVRPEPRVHEVARGLCCR